VVSTTCEGSSNPPESGDNDHVQATSNNQAEHVQESQDCIEMNSTPEAALEAAREVDTEESEEDLAPAAKRPRTDE